MFVIQKHYPCRQAHERGGGVGAYIRSVLNYTRLDYNVTHTEILWLTINQNCFDTIVIGVIYRKPNTDVDQFQRSLIGVLEEVNVGKQALLLIGDFNIDVSQTIDQKIYDYLIMIESIGMQQVISSPTSVTNSTSSVIDNVYTNVYNHAIHSGVIKTDLCHI